MDVVPLDPLQLHVVQVVFVLANQMLMAPNVQLVNQVIMDFPTAKVKIKHSNFLRNHRRHFHIFQLVDVVHLDPLQQYVAQVVCVLAKQMLMAQNVQHVSQVIMDFPTAKVKIKTFQIFEKALETFTSFSACGCSTSGSTSTSCSSSGVCSCKTNVDGTKCITCKSGYYGFPNCQGRN